jgi:D-glycero-D-manno-heptose 1,7-bisphosphate phosphatase
VSGAWTASAGAGLLAFRSANRAAIVGARPAAFLDRDGVLNELVHNSSSGTLESPHRVEDVRLVEGAAAAVTVLARAGFLLVCVSNQPGAAKGEVTVPRLRAVHERLIEMLAQEGAHLDASRLCLHHPEGSDSNLGRSCACRKPAPGMLLDAAADLAIDFGGSLMVGDSDSDIAAGRLAGCKTILLLHPGSAHKRAGGASPDLVASELAGAVAQIVQE